MNPESDEGTTMKLIGAVAAVAMWFGASAAIFKFSDKNEDEATRLGGILFIVMLVILGSMVLAEVFHPFGPACSL